MMIEKILLVAQKEWKIFRRYPSWIIALFIWPVIFPFTYIFTSKALAGVDGAAVDVFQGISGTDNYTGFIVIGAVLWMWVNFTLWSIGGFLRNEQMRGTLESNWLSPASRMVHLLGASFFFILVNLFVMAIVVLNFSLVFNVEFTGNLLLGSLVYLLTLPTVYGLGMLFASLVVWAKEINAMVFLVRGIFMVFCGMTYPLAVLPDWMRAVSRFIPLTYSIDALRKVFLMEATFADVRGDIMMLLLFSVILVAGGALAFKFTEARVKESGSLGVY